MIKDFAMQVSTAQVVTAAAVSTDSVDLSSAGAAGAQGAIVGANPHSIGTGRVLRLLVSVAVTATAAGAAIVTFQIITSAAAALTTPSVLGASDGYAVATLSAGRQPIVINVNPDIGNAQGDNLRFLGMRYLIATGPLTAGAFTAGFFLDVQDARVFPASTSS
ncbi:MAG: hypothetical protein V3S43_01080 [Acidimicrobiia bacterium]